MADQLSGAGPDVETSDKLTLTEHLVELRQRLVRSVIAAGMGFGVCYVFIDPIFEIFSRPLLAVLPPESELIFTSYPEAFFTYLKLALASGIFLAGPFILYQAWAFVVPGLYEHEKRWVLPFVLMSAVFFIGGGLFGYFVVFPTAFKFFAGYSGEHLRLLPSVSEYFTLTLRLLLGFGAAFELPIFMVFLGLTGIVNAVLLRRNRKYAILIIFLLAAIITPTPDIVNQILMAGPLMLLYELSIMLVWFTERKT